MAVWRIAASCAGLPGQPELCALAAPTCRPTDSPWASGNSCVSGGQREGGGGVGGYHHPSHGISKLIAFDFAPPSTHARPFPWFCEGTERQHISTQEASYLRRLSAVARALRTHGIFVTKSLLFPLVRLIVGHAFK